MHQGFLMFFCGSGGIFPAPFPSCPVMYSAVAVGGCLEAYFVSLMFVVP